MNHGLDTDSQVFFYEQEFYVLSNFSAFAIDEATGHATRTCQNILSSLVARRLVQRTTGGILASPDLF